MDVWQTDVKMDMRAQRVMADIPHYKGPHQALTDNDGKTARNRVERS